MKNILPEQLRYIARTLAILGGKASVQELFRAADELERNDVLMAQGAQKIEELQREVEGLRGFKRSVDEALNSGDGSYRP